MQFLQRLQAEKDRKKQAGWDVEDRELNKRYKEAQITNLNEPNIAPPKPIKLPSNVTPKMVKSFMGRLGYPQEAIDGVDDMTPEDLFKTWEDVQKAYNSQTLAGKKIPAKPPTPKGAFQAKKLDADAKRMAEAGRMYAVAWQSVAGGPNAMLMTRELAEYRRIAENFQDAANEIMAMKDRIDDEGELSEQDYAKLQALLKVTAATRTKNTPTPSDKPKTDAEKKLPPGFVIQK
jgi:hypothetical protein